MGVRFNLATGQLSSQPNYTPTAEENRANIRPVTMRQARLALLGAGLLGDAEAALNALPSPAKEAALIEWEYASAVERGSPLITSMAGALNLDDAALDALFIAASAL